MGLARKRYAKSCACSRLNVCKRRRGGGGGGGAVNLKYMERDESSGHKMGPNVTNPPPLRDEVSSLQAAQAGGGGGGEVPLKKGVEGLRVLTRVDIAEPCFGYVKLFPTHHLEASQPPLHPSACTFSRVKWLHSTTAFWYQMLS